MQKVCVCGVDCKPGDHYCNGYCEGKTDHPPQALPYYKGSLDDGGDAIFFEGRPVVFEELIDKLNLMHLQNADYVRRLREIQKWCT